MTPRQRFIENISEDVGIDSDTLTELVSSLDAIPGVSCFFTGSEIVFSIFIRKEESELFRLTRTGIEFDSARLKDMILRNEINSDIIDVLSQTSLVQIEENCDRIILETYRTVHGIYYH